MFTSLRRIFSVMAMCIVTIVSYAAIPANYYSSLAGKKDAELKNAVSMLISKLTSVSSYSDLPRYFQTTDVYPASSRWWDMYSNIPLYAPSFKGLNREHSFPKSWWGGSTSVKAYTDLNHLYPSEAAANQAKSNYVLGEVDMSYKVTFDNGVVKVGYPLRGQGGGQTTVFEPDEEYKGDFARTYFYMATCYQDYTWTSRGTAMLQQNLYPTLQPWAYEMLLRWSREDEVSQKEIDRNDAVYRFQNNRNPFIDFPELAEYIWGNKKGHIFNPESGGDPEIPTGDPDLIAPTNNINLEFGQVALGQRQTAQLFFRGENIRGSMDVVVYGTDKAMFSVDATTIPAASVNNINGFYLPVRYNPTATGQHVAKIAVSGGGIVGSRVINLRGECLPVPQLSVIKATPATDVTSESYVANWEEPGDVVDYYIVNRTRYVGGEQYTEQLTAEENSLLIEGFGNSDSESYTVQSVRLGYTSTPSNVIYVSSSGIQGIEADKPLILEAFPGGFRFLTSDVFYGVCVYDISGKLIASLQEADGYTEVLLPPGVYIVSAPGSTRPQRIIVR